MIHYILQVVVFQLLFLIVYDFFLKRETFFNVNRVYLLVTPLLSLVLPFIEVAIIAQQIPENYIIQLPAVVIGEQAVEGSTLLSENGYLLTNLKYIIFFTGIGIASLLFLRKLISIQKMKRSGAISKFDRFTLVSIPDSTMAFTFFRTIFLGEELSEGQRSHILAHEQVHVEQKHSWDLFFFEVLRMLFWFNPLVYIYQKRMATLQEYIADASVAAQKDKKAYYQSLLSEVFQTAQVSFINTFFNHSFIKNRIIMLQKSKSKKIVLTKYLLVIPLLAAMITYTSCSQETETANASGSDLTAKIADLTAEIESKETLTDEEKGELARMILLTYPEGVEGISGPNGSVVKGYANNEVIEVQEIPLGTDMPFAVVDKVPVFPGCEGMTNEQAKTCMSQKIATHVLENFNKNIQNTTTSKRRISVVFKIDKSGAVVDVKARAATPELQEEAIRVVRKLPRMTPGEHQGTKVGVLYALPIIFDIK